MVEIAYGFTNFRDILADRVDTIGVERMNQAIRESAQAWTREVNTLLDRFVGRTTEREFQVDLFDGSGTMQPLDADGNPRKRVVTGSYGGFPVSLVRGSLGL